MVPSLGLSVTKMGAEDAAGDPEALHTAPPHVAGPQFCILRLALLRVCPPPVTTALPPKITVPPGLWLCTPLVNTASQATPQARGICTLNSRIKHQRFITPPAP